MDCSAALYVCVLSADCTAALYGEHMLQHIGDIDVPPSHLRLAICIRMTGMFPAPQKMQTWVEPPTR